MAAVLEDCLGVNKRLGPALIQPAVHHPAPLRNMITCARLVVMGCAASPTKQHRGAARLLHHTILEKLLGNFPAVWAMISSRRALGIWG